MHSDWHYSIQLVTNFTCAYCAVLYAHPLLLASPALSRSPPVSSNFISKSLSPRPINERQRGEEEQLVGTKRGMDLLERSTIKADEGERKEQQQLQQEKEPQQGLTRPPLANGSSR